MSNEKRAPGCLVHIGDYTTQLCEDYNKPLLGSLLNNQDDSWKVRDPGFVDRGSLHPFVC